MTTTATILKEHGIDTVTLSNGTVLANEEENNTYVNVTNWSNNKLALWLGY